MRSAVVLFLCLIPFLLISKTWYVGPSEVYTKPSEVSSLVSDGDTVYIYAGEYKKDVCRWTADNLHLIGIGGYVHLNAEKTAYGGKAIWVIAGDNTYVEGIEFSNCEVVDLNGAGIRQEGKNLHVRYCYFHNNQNGILAGNNPESDIIVEYSEFSNNGAGDGFSHNIYINHVRSLIFQYNYVHHAFYGHEIKSRAYKNIILYNRITNEDGSASYEIDLPDGGPALIMGNIIQQSRYSDNNSFISYARESFSNPGPHNFYFIHNTVVNLEDKGIVFNLQSNSDTVLSANNIFAGPMSILVGIPKIYINQNNVVNSDLSYFHFNSTGSYDYHLTPQSPGIDSAIQLNQYFLNYNLEPDKEYEHTATWKKRFDDQHPDIGSFELQQITRNEYAQSKANTGYYDNASRKFIISLQNELANRTDERFNLFNMDGKLMASKKISEANTIDLNDLATGVYYYQLQINSQLLRGAFVVTD
jgi:hypothetical protein